MSGLKQTTFAAAATVALLCLPIRPAAAAGPLLVAPWVLGHIIRAGVSLATLPLVLASAASAQQPPTPGYYGGRPGYYAPPINYYARPPAYYPRAPGYYARSAGYSRAPQAYYRSPLAYARPMPQFYAQTRGYHAPSGGFSYRGR
jgi:hypothetical protein